MFRQRPQSSLARPSTPFQRQQEDNRRNLNFNQNSNRQKLSNLIPDMPALIPKNKSTTALLYSKFIVKGIKTNKIDLVKQSFNMKKQNMRYQKKMSLNVMKTIRSTRVSTKNQALKSIRHDQNQMIEFQRNNNWMIDHSKNLNLEINNFFRINYNNNNNNKKDEQRVMIEREKGNNVQNNQTERKMIKAASQNVLKRPKSAFSSPYTCTRNTRAQTAFRKNVIPSDRFTLDTQDFRAIIPQKNIMTINPSEKSGFGFVNHIQRNKRQLSASSKKTSIYLTGVDNKITQNLNKEIKKMPLRKYQQAIKSHAYKLSMGQLPFALDEPKNQRLSYQPSTNEIDEDIFDFNQAVKQQKTHEKQQDNLVSINLAPRTDQFGQIDMTKRNQDEALHQANDYYNEYAHICQQTQYYIKKNLKKKQQPKQYNQVLHVGMCQQLLQLYRTRIQIPVNQKAKLTQINLKIYHIIKILAFFKFKLAELSLRILELNVKIISFQEEQIIIRKGDEVKYFYVILNGSVIKQTESNRKQSQESYLKHQSQVIISSNTYFDGQTFGQPDTLLKTNYNCQIKAAQKLLLLQIPYLQYKQICNQSQNIHERVILLKNIFGNVSGYKIPQQQYFEALASQMQVATFQAKQIIFRQNDVCDKLIIPASGKILLANQHVLKRSKNVPKDMKKKSRSNSKLKVKNFSIQKLRRTNLKNYQILSQNEQEFIFYYQNSVKQLIRGDVINWKGFAKRFTIQNQEKQLDSSQRNYDLNKSTLKGQPHKLNYSLISNTDNVKIYTLTIQKIKNLPEHFKQIIYAKIQEQLKKQQKKTKPTKNKLQSFQKVQDIAKWDRYKQKICKQIINKKLKM